MLIRQNLDFNVPRVLEKLLHVHRGIAKGALRLGLGHGHGVDQGRLSVHHTHAAPAAAACGFDDDRVAHRACNTANLHRIIRQLALRSRHTGHAGLDHRLLGRDLVAHDPD